MHCASVQALVLRSATLAHTHMRNPNEEQIEQRLTDLIRQFQEIEARRPVDVQAIGETEKKIFDAIAEYLSLVLRPTLARVFGSGVVSSSEDSGVRFSAMLNDLFIKILEKEKQVALRLSTARHLRNWCSRVIVNQMIDYMRREKVKERALADIAPLYDIRKRTYSTRFGESFDDILEVIQDWRDSPHENLRQYETLLKLHYIIGLSWHEVCDVMGLPKSTFYEVRNRAIERLKQELNPEARIAP